MKYLVQTRGGRTYTELFERAANIGAIESLDAAVAYATIGGVNALLRTMKHTLDDRWEKVSKRWLIGIDWCRTDPPALRALQLVQHSTVKVPNGRALVESAGCSPRDTFHPKLFVLKARNVTAVICGSGNLSANGLMRGCECGNLSIFETEAAEDLEPILTWYRNAWDSADDVDAIAATYETICQKRVRVDKFAPTDDDMTPPAHEGVTEGRSLSGQQIREFRTFKNFWIDAGALGANFGRGIPGNQLDMKRFTRVFFGASVENLAPQTEINQITLLWDGQRLANRTLKYGDNHMDKLNVPPPGDHGRMFYKDKTLLFRRAGLDEYEFHVGDSEQRKTWRKSSKASGVVHRLSVTREWGLF